MLWKQDRSPLAGSLVNWCGRTAGPHDYPRMVSITSGERSGAEPVTE